MDTYRGMRRPVGKPPRLRGWRHRTAICSVPLRRARVAGKRQPRRIANAVGLLGVDEERVAPRWFGAKGGRWRPQAGSSGASSRRRRAGPSLQPPASLRDRPRGAGPVPQSLSTGPCALEDSQRHAPLRQVTYRRIGGSGQRRCAWPPSRALLGSTESAEPATANYFVQGPGMLAGAVVRPQLSTAPGVWP
jgi:hypothetical protein